MEHEAETTTLWTFDMGLCEARHSSGLTFTFARTPGGQWVGTVGNLENARPDLIALHRREGAGALKRALDPLMEEAIAVFNASRALQH